jgi:hypothetical protein
MAYLSVDYKKIMEEFEKWLESKCASIEVKKVQDKFLSIKKKYTTVVGVGKDKGSIGMIGKSNEEIK